LNKQLGDVFAFDVASCLVAAEHAADVHEATDVDRGNDIGTGLDDILDFALAHGQRGTGHFHAEGATETAALFNVWQFAVVDVTDVLEQCEGLFEDAQLASTMATAVHGDLPGEASAGIGDAEDIDEELGEFEDALSDSDDSFIGIDVFEEDAAHGGAGCRRADDPLVGLEGVAELVDDAASFFPVSGIEGGLAAAGLLFGIGEGHAVPGEQLGRGFTDFREELVDVAGNEKCDRFTRFVLGVFLRVSRG